MLDYVRFNLINPLLDMYTFLKFAPPGPCTCCILNVMDTQWDFSCDVACNIAKTRLHCATTCAMLCLHGEVHCLWCNKSRTRFYFFSHATSHKWSHGVISNFCDIACNVPWKIASCVCTYLNMSFLELAFKLCRIACFKGMLQISTNLCIH